MSDAGEEDDVAWLDARERGLAVDHIAAERRARYRNLERHIAELAPEGWQDRVFAQIDPPRRRPRRTVWLVAPTFATAAVVLILLVHGRPRPDLLAIEWSHDGVAYRDGEEIRIHDTLRVRPDPSLVDVRVYSEQAGMLAHCPGGPGCRADGTIVVEIPTGGDIAIIGFSGCTPPTPGADRAKDEDLARAAHCTIVRHAPVTAR